MSQASKSFLLAAALSLMGMASHGECRADMLGPSDSALISTFQEGKYAAAEPLARKSLREADSKYATAVALNNLAEVLYNLGRHEEARPMYESSLNLIEQVHGSDHPDVAVVLNNQGGMQRELGEFGTALPLIERALTITQTKLGARHPATATSLNNLGLLYKQTGQPDQARTLLERSLSIREESFGPQSFETGRSLNNLASVYVQLQRYEQALALYERALAITIKVFGSDHVAAAIRLNNIASVHYHLENYDKAVQLYEQALAIAESSLGPLHISNASNMNNLASVYEATNQPAKSRVLYERALLISIAATVPENSFNILANLARFHDGQGHAGAAIFFAKQAVNIFQEIRFNALTMDRGVRKSLIDKNQQIYHELANWLIDQERISEATQVLKMLKEEEYFDFIRRDAAGDSRRTRVEFNDSEQAWAMTFDGLSEEARLLWQERHDENSTHGDDSSRKNIKDQEIRASLSTLEKRFLKQFDDLTTALGRETALEKTTVQDARLAKARAEISSIGKDLALVEYLIVGDRIRMLVTTARGILVRTVDIDRDDFHRKLVSFRQKLENRFADPRPDAKALYGVLIAPIASELKTAQVKTLLLSLEGGLRYIPFAALHDGKKYLVEQYALSMYTAAAQTEETGRAVRRWEISAFGASQAQGGFSALPGVRQELDSIVGDRGLSGEIHLDEQFTSAQMRISLAKELAVLHVASHFKFSPGTEEDSFLLLGDGKPLTLRQLREGNFHFGKLDLLTLSACETAMSGGRAADGREVEGMGTLAQNKGAKAVLASLWSISDASTPELMQYFYSGRERKHFSTADALRHAQIALLNGIMKPKQIDSENPSELRGTIRLVPAAINNKGFTADPKAPYSHPYFWAPFVLIGNSI